MWRPSVLVSALFLVFLPGLLGGSIACSGSDPEEDTDTQGRDVVSQETSQCIGTHPASEPFDVGDVALAAAMPGQISGQMSGGATPAGPTLQSFVAECRAESGTDCDEAFISKEAARCIAENDRFEPGLEAWTISMTYHHSYHRVVWGVENLLQDRGDDGYSGKSLTIDAATGEVLGRTNWSATP